MRWRMVSGIADAGGRAGCPEQAARVVQSVRDAALGAGGGGDRVGADCAARFAGVALGRVAATGAGAPMDVAGCAGKGKRDAQAIARARPPPVRDGVEKGAVSSRACGQLVIWEHFNGAMAAARGKGQPSLAEMWASDKHLLRFWKTLLALEMATNFSFQTIRRVFSLCFYMCSNFAPGAAADLIDHAWWPTHLGDHRTGVKVLDPCAGFGGRMLGFLASSNGHTYVGIDPNSALHPSYESLLADIRRFDERPGGARHRTLRMIKGCAESVDYAPLVAEFAADKGGFDLVLTSPPYFDAEQYTGEGTQSCVRFKSLQTWRDGFLFPMLRKSIGALRRGGVALINIKNMRDWDLDIGAELCAFAERECGCRHERTLQLVLHKRIGTGQVAGAPNAEPIFLFRRPAT